MLNQSLSAYLKREYVATTAETSLNEAGGFLTISNTAPEKKSFDIGIGAVIRTLENIRSNLSDFSAYTSYEEKQWRELAVDYFTDPVARPLVAQQTKSFFATLSRIIKWANSPVFDDIQSDKTIEMTDIALLKAIDKMTLVLGEYIPKPTLKIKYSKTPENILFYGPPGTGKTREIQNRYLKGVPDDEREFITFHQSYSYEEFIEGIKPNISQEEKVLLNHSKIRDFAYGAFRYLLESFGDHVILTGKRTATGSIDEKQYTAIKIPKYFGESNLIAEFSSAQTKEDLSSSNTLRYFEADLELEEHPHSYFTTQWVDSGERKLSFFNLKRFIKEISGGDLEAVKQGEEYLLIQKLSHSAGLKYEFSDGIFYRACKRAATLAGYSSLEDCMADSMEGRAKKFKQALDDGNVFTFCIDEINRGNVASVFGELITLIEVDKRLGAENELQVKLPYSKRSFGVPANLQLIGSMNTADRSITLLDSALRRRFRFLEIGPDPEALKHINLEGIELNSLLSILNKRITYFIGKDLNIGHSYFFSGLDPAKPTKKDLLALFLDKIIPLLEEYFYNDMARVALVLGDGSKDKTDWKFYVIDKSWNVAKLFKGYNEDLDEKEVFILNPELLKLRNSSEAEIDADVFKLMYLV